MNNRYRLIVVGAGPAGGYAALTAARSGLDVLLIERDPEPGTPLACAEAISKTGLSGFIDPDESFIASEIYSLAFTVATGYRFVYRNNDLLGYVLDRPAFDKYLAERAADAGVDVRTRTFADEIELRDGGPARLHLTAADGEEWIEADFVIAADGVESMIGRRAGLRTLLPLSRSDASLQYRVSDIDVNPDCLEFCVGEKYSPDGYLWVFAKSNRSANIGLGFNPAANNRGDLRKILDGFLGERYENYTVEFETCGLVPKFRGLDNIGRDNLLLAGDAARTVDSLTGAGIAKGMHTGKLAAETVIAAAAGEIPIKRLVEQYREAIDREIGKELRFLERASRVFRKFNDKDWESMARFLESALTKEKAGSIDPAALVREALKQSPRLLRLARHVI